VLIIFSFDLLVFLFNVTKTLKPISVVDGLHPSVSIHASSYASELASAEARTETA
jgi:hypothetical protein